MKHHRLYQTKTIAISAAGLLLLWFASSLIFPPSRGGEKADASTEAVTPILSVKKMVAEPHRRYIKVNGETEASKLVGLMAETSGKVTKILATEGQPVEKGAVILHIDERDRPAQLARARAVLNQREIQYKAARKLQKQGFQSEVRLAETRADLEVARADLKAIEQDLSFTKLRAPFEGVLDSVNVEVGDFVFAGAPGNVPDAPVVMVDLDPMIVKGFVSEKDWSAVRVGDVAQVKLNHGSVAQGKIAYLASVSEAESRSFRIEIEVPNEERAIASGVTATLEIPAKEYLGHLLSSSVLSLNDEGTIGAKYLDDENVVRFQPIEIIEEVSRGVWVSGLPETVRIITGGQIYVSQGQQVTAEMYRMAGDSGTQSKAETAPEEKGVQ